MSKHIIKYWRYLNDANTSWYRNGYSLYSDSTGEGEGVRGWGGGLIVTVDVPRGRGSLAPVGIIRTQINISLSY